MTMIERWDNFLEKTTLKLKEQDWFVQLQNQFDQMAPEQQNAVKWGSIGGGAFVFLYICISTLQSANSVKDDYFEKQDLLQLVNRSGDEIRRLKGQNAGLTQGAPPEWKMIFQSLVSTQGMTPDSVEILKNSPGVAQNVIQESLLEVQIKNIPTKSLTQILFTIEHGSPPMKLKGISIDTGADGLLVAKLNISGFIPKPEKSDKPEKK